MKAIQMRTANGYSFRACCSKGISHHHLELSEIQRQVVEWETLIVERREASGMPGLETICMGKL